MFDNALSNNPFIFFTDLMESQKLTIIWNIKLTEVNRRVNGRYSRITDVTSLLKLYDTPRSPLIALVRNHIYCICIGLSRFKDSLTCSASFGLNVGLTNFCTGSPGEILTRKKRKVMIKKRIMRELKILLIKSLAIVLLI